MPVQLTEAATNDLAKKHTRVKVYDAITEEKVITHETGLHGLKYRVTNCGMSRVYYCLED